jgi:lysozyme family protein
MAVKNISTHEVEEIYNEIWISCGSAQMPDKLAIVHFDTSFNLGTRRAVRMLQEILGIEMDGKVGKETINACQIDGIALLYIDARDKYYHSISEKNIKLLVFLKGWLNRTSDLRKLL